MAVASSWSITGAGEFAAQLAAAATQVQAMVPVVVGKSAADLNALVKINANKPSSGPPGPRNITGDYLGSWRVEPVVQSPQVTSLSVGTDRPQANRLEYGFVGTDSIGRTYDQPPYPHLKPAEDVIDPIFAAAMEMIVVKALNG